MRNHYIPQFVIREFADSSGKVAVYDRSTGTIHKSNPKDVFVVSNFYSDETEKAIAAKEGIISAIIKGILNTCRNGTRPAVSTKEVLNCCRYFVLLQYARSPHTKSIGLNNLEVDIEQRLFQDLEAAGLDMSDRTVLEKVELAKQRTLEDANRNRKSKVWSGSVDNFLRNPADALPNVVNAIEGKGVVLAKTRSSFILGDRGAISTAGGGVNLDDPSREIFFPVSPDVAISLSGERDQVKMLMLGMAATRKANLSMMRMNDLVISQSTRLLSSLADPR